MFKYLKNIIMSPQYTYKNNMMLKKIAKDNQRNITLNLQNQALNSKDMGISGNNPPQKLIVSLTTYGKRTENVYIVIESLFRQSKKADKIILWLAEDEFNDDTLPETLNMARNRGLEIGYCKDLKSYKKLIPTLAKYPNDLIITVDDDIMYPLNFIDVLYRAYKQNPTVIHCTSGNEIKFTKSGEIADYKKWKGKLERGHGKKIFNLSGAGSLYFPGCFHEDVCRDDIFMDLCPTNDDMWFKCMNLLAGVDAKLLDRNCGFEKGGFVDYSLPDFKYDTLWSKNRLPQNGTTTQLKRIFKKYNLYKKFLN